MKYIVALGMVGAGFFALSYVGLPEVTSVEYASVHEVQSKSKADNPSTHEEKVVADTREVVSHVPLPVPLKAIYMTSCVAGTPSFRDRLVRLIDETEINAVVIDIKDYSGTISFPPPTESWKPAWQHARCGTSDMKQFIATLHEKGIFVIGRITVFQDPFYAERNPSLAVHRASDGGVWHDHKGLSFIDVGSRAYWDHIALLARDSYNIGFDELNFDYVRYPSDGNMQDTAFTNSLQSEYGNDKQANLEAFFAYLNDKMDDESFFAEYRHEHTGRASSTPWTSVDLFGMTTTNYDDLSIGQVIERAAPYFDFIAPMVYPSHYPHDYLGLGNPNDHPYKIVHHAMKSGVDRMTSPTTQVAGFTHTRMGTSTPALYAKPIYTADKLRTWIQDFDYGGDYDALDVQNQIQASVDAGVHSYMVWAPSNIYTREAFSAE
jgi:hypothetical protein